MLLSRMQSICIFSLFTCCVYVNSQQLSGKFRTSELMRSQSDQKGLWTVNFVATFLLGSFRGAVQLGEPDMKNEEDDTRDNFERVVNAKLTWAHNLRHFYMVTGSGQTENRILSNATACHNSTAHYRGIIPHNAFEMYRCHGIMVLHLPHCDNSGWGSQV